MIDSGPIQNRNEFQNTQASLPSVGRIGVYGYGIARSFVSIVCNNGFTPAASGDRLYQIGRRPAEMIEAEIDLTLRVMPNTQVIFSWKEPS